MISGNGESFIFTIKNEKDIIKLKCINKLKEIWNSKDSMPSFGILDLRIFNESNLYDKSFSDVGNSYELPKGVENDS
jgi:hypothetical protein